MKTLFGLRVPGLMGVSLAVCISAAMAADGPATYARWQKIELTFTGPASRSMGTPNPFQIPFDVVFTSPSGQTFKAPGFYDGDGRSSPDGNVWKVRFSADANGAWTYKTASPQAELNGRSGSFTVVDPASDAPELYRRGRLEYVNERYLKFREGGYWLKFGADEPENLLGDAFGRNDWARKKREIDYIAERGINSMYIMTHTLGGDGNDVWPWPGSTPDEAKKHSDRFDITKLDKWLDLFEYIQSKGIVIHLVLEDDSAWIDYDHTRYYREIIARFGYLPALYFNFCEEYNERYTLEQAIEHMEILQSLDPYNHPRTIHNVRNPDRRYVAADVLNVSSIQTWPSSPEELNQLAIDWIEAPLIAGRRPLVVSFDEARPADDRRSWWAVYMGGGMWESYLPVQESFSEIASHWEELAATQTFFKDLPFHRMFPANHLITEGTAFCLALPGEAYGAYVPAGGKIKLDLTGGNRYRAAWFDPRTGVRDRWSKEFSLSGGTQSLSPPSEGDWGLRIIRTQGSRTGPPVISSGRLHTLGSSPVPVHLPVLHGKSESLQFEIVSPPAHGKLTGEGAERVFTPSPEYTGPDRFQWRVTGRAGTSNVATIEIHSNASGRNQPPQVEDLSITTTEGKPVNMILRYEDPDGPGPHQIGINRPPAHGELEGQGNDRTYVPRPGFTGVDTFRWRVDDGDRWSRVATVTITVTKK